MRRIGWILGFMLSMGFPSAFAMEGATLRHLWFSWTIRASRKRLTSKTSQVS